VYRAKRRLVANTRRFCWRNRGNILHVSAKYYIPRDKLKIKSKEYIIHVRVLKSVVPLKVTDRNFKHQQFEVGHGRFLTCSSRTSVFFLAQTMSRKIDLSNRCNWMQEALSITVLFDVTPHGLIGGHQNFEELILLPWRRKQHVPSKRRFISTWRHIPNDSNLHI
jgi:hypothetical protein